MPFIPFLFSRSLFTKQNTILIAVLTMPLVCLAQALPLEMVQTKSPVQTEVLTHECHFQWDVKARGLSAGTTRDTVRWSNGSLSVTSLFTPNAMASVLGAPTLERKWMSSSANKSISREETKYKATGESEKTRWTVKGGKLWKNFNLGARQDVPAPENATAGLVVPGVPGIRYIDSTIFAYLDLAGQSLAMGPSVAWVLNRQAPYQANTQRTADTVEYSAGNKHGTVYLSAGKPTKLSFSEGSEAFEATVVSTDCK